MTTDGRGTFAGGDQAYLRDVQYADSSKLAVRANLHVKYGKGTWFSWWAQQVPWPTAGSVLEVGCGAGWLWADAGAEVPPGLDLTLTDLSPGMVAEAIDRATALGTFGSVTGRTADVQDLPFASGTFAVVASNQMLYHVPDPALGVAEIARVVRPDGLAAVATNGWHHLTELWQIRAELFPELDDHDETVEVFGIETGEPLLRARFGSVELRRYPDVLRCTDPADVVAFIASTPPTDTAGPEVLEHLRAVVARRFDEGGGVLEVTKESGLFLCTDPR